MDAVAPGLGAYINYGIPFARRASVKNLVAADQAESERVHQRIAGVAGLEFHLAAKVGDAETVAVRSDARDHAFHDRVVFVNFSLCGSGALPRSDGAKPRPHTDWPKPQRVHHRDGACAHGENVAQNSADASGGSLKWFDKRRVIVRLDLERAGPAVANVNDAGIFTRPLHHQLAARGQTFQVNARRLIRAMLAPHHAENAEFGPRGLASAEQLFDFVEFFRREAVLPDRLRRNGSDRRGGHRGIFIVASQPTFRMWIRTRVVWSGHSCPPHLTLIWKLKNRDQHKNQDQPQDQRRRTRVSAPHTRLYCRR